MASRSRVPLLAAVGSVLLAACGARSNLNAHRSSGEAGLAGQAGASMGGQPGGGVGGGVTGGGGSGHDCCVPGNLPSCGDAAVEACVCGHDSYCCGVVWDETCVAEVEIYGCDECGGGGSGGGPVGGSGGWITGGVGGWISGGSGGVGGQSDCCVATAQPGCRDPDIESCVCDEDFYCCNGAWDGTCVLEVDQLGCGWCGGGGSGGAPAGGGGSGGSDESCCAMHPTPGCEDDPVSPAPRRGSRVARPGYGTPSASPGG